MKKPDDNILNATPEVSLIETIGQSDLSDLGIDMGELGIDLLLDDSALREIPIVKTVISVAKGGLAIRDYLLMKKLIRFLSYLKEIPMEERQQFAAKAKAEKHGHRIGESLLLFLDRYDHLEKVEILAQLFIAYLGEVIDLDEFLRFSSSVDQAYIGDLKALLNYFSGARNGIEKALWVNLYRSGFSQPVLNMKVDNGLGGTVGIVMSRGTGNDLLGFTFNLEAAKFSIAVLGDRFVHPQGLTWDKKLGSWQLNA